MRGQKITTQLLCKRCYACVLVTQAAQAPALPKKLPVEDDEGATAVHGSGDESSDLSGVHFHLELHVVLRS